MYLLFLTAPMKMIKTDTGVFNIWAVQHDSQSYWCSSVPRDLCISQTPKTITVALCLRRAKRHI